MRSRIRASAARDAARWSRSAARSGSDGESGTVAGGVVRRHARTSQGWWEPGDATPAAAAASPDFVAPGSRTGYGQPPAAPSQRGQVSAAGSSTSRRSQRGSSSMKLAAADGRSAGAGTVAGARHRQRPLRPAGRRSPKGTSVTGPTRRRRSTWSQVRRRRPPGGIGAKCGELDGARWTTRTRGGTKINSRCRGSGTRRPRKDYQGVMLINPGGPGGSGPRPVGPRPGHRPGRRRRRATTGSASTRAASAPAARRSLRRRATSTTTGRTYVPTHPGS